MTGAVLLIIGMAVIGPIEPAPIPAYCVVYIQDHQTACAVWAAENTVAKICERAMKEIGATPIRTITQERFEREGLDGTRPPDYWRVNGEKATCIPAPSGLRTK